ncbi:TPA: hypothetical protein N0F65_001030, partial [Lagenidium giganteum]
GTRPSISRLRVWGCVAFWFVIKAQRASKLAPLRRSSLFVGYPTKHYGVSDSRYGVGQNC